ncbi:MAG: hypothetical protein NC126_11090 [Clostridium sp.]|nr:hypothetical protein [Clostridium sp.]
MALHDWNHNGKKDVVDDYIEYQIYKETTKSNNAGGNASEGSDGMSTFGAIAATIGGLFLATGVVALFGGGENTPAALIVILCLLALP